MRRVFAVILLAALVFCLSATAGAVTGASSIDNYTTVSSDGTCEVSLNITLHLESALGEIAFPVPGNARDVSLGGNRAKTTRSGDLLMVDLSKQYGGITGDFAVNIRYSLPNCVAYDDDDHLMLTLPLVCGFAYPVERMSFTVALPGAATAYPSFTSTYRQANIEQDLELDVATDPSKITGQLNIATNDHESLTMTLEVDPQMFPQKEVHEWSVSFEDVAMVVLAVLAVIYWIVFLRCLPPRRIRRTTPPDGLTAGELGCALTMQGTDLTMMVVTWAQLGYILIHLDDNGRVILHRRMSMGNERSSYENRVFKALFGKRKLVDGTGYHYARLCKKVAAKSSVSGIYRRSSGNPRLFRLISALPGLLGGIALARAIAGDSIFAILLIILFAGLGFISAWYIQEGGACLHLRSKEKLWLSLACIGGWLVFGVLGSELMVAASVAFGEFLAGIAAAYGGKRTELGKQSMQQILGLRRYLKTVERADLHRILRSNPDYYYSLAPYALALGVDQKFAKRFGAVRLSGCPYLTSLMDGHMTALEWSKLLRDAVNTLDARQKRMFMERLLGR